MPVDSSGTPPDRSVSSVMRRRMEARISSIDGSIRWRSSLISRSHHGRGPTPARRRHHSMAAIAPVPALRLVVDADAEPLVADAVIVRLGVVERDLQAEIAGGEP